MKLAGKLLDRTGSLIVLEADSLADAWEIVARDPYVTEGIFNLPGIGQATFTYQSNA